MSAATLSKLAVLVAWFAYATAATTALMTTLTKKPSWLRVTFRATTVGIVAQVIGLVTIVVANGRAPWGTLYEWVMSASAVIVVTALVLIVRKAEFSTLTSIVLGFVVVLMMAGASQYQEPGELVPALQSTWLTFHVALALIGSGLLLFGGVVSALYLIRHRWESRYLGAAGGDSPEAAATLDTPEEEIVPMRVADDTEGGLATLVSQRTEVSTAVGPDMVTKPAPGRGFGRRLPSTENLDDLARKVFTLAFPIYTLAILAGAVWGEQAWGRYWAWDPKETTSFIIWGLFAAYLHARATRGWRGTGAAWLGVIGAVAVVFNSFFVNLVISGLHSYAGG